METIQEFLVSLGYALKESEVSAWERTAQKAHAAVMKAGAFLERLERKAKDLFVETTVALDQVNFAAQRAGSSVEEVRALAYALEQTGVNGGRAENILDTFASHLRRFPALAGVLHNLGVKTKENGQLRDTALVFEDAMKAIHKIQDYPTAARTADLFGISEEDYYNLRSNADKIDKAKQDKRDAYRRYGVNGKEAGISSTLVMQGWNRMLMTLDVMMAKIAMALGPALMPIIDDLKAWLEKHQEEIVAVCRALVAALSDLIAALKKIIDDPSGAWRDIVMFMETMGRGLLDTSQKLSGRWMDDISAKLTEPFDEFLQGVRDLIDWLLGRKKLPHPTFSSGGGIERGPSQAAPQKQGFFSRAKSFVGRLFGYGGDEASGGQGGGEPGADAAPASTEPAMSLVDARKRFAKELEDPEVAARLAAYTQAEVGSQGAAAQQAFIESILNRAAARGQTLRQTLSGSYFPGITHSRAAGYMRDPRYLEKYKSMMDAVLSGSNISNYATGNASGTVGFDGGPGTFSAGGERFGIEGSDRAWARRMREYDAAHPQPAAAPEPPRTKIIIEKPAGEPASIPDKQSLYAPPLGSTHTFDLAANQETEIVVHGDPDPTRTMTEVSAAQLRVNKGLTDQVGRAVA